MTNIYPIINTFIIFTYSSKWKSFGLHTKKSAYGKFVHRITRDRRFTNVSLWDIDIESAYKLDKKHGAS